MRAWFVEHFPAGPTDPQRLGWRSIRTGSDTLLAAPTGSGKTLAGFLVAIDHCLRSAEAGDALDGGPRVVYVSPLKALAVDVQENLREPLTGIASKAASLGVTLSPLTVGVRSGDTPAAERAAMLRQPPNIIVTTPESLFLMVTASRSRELLRQVQTVVVDEIHTMARDKRGAHLSLTLERLDRIQTGSRPQRIGLSATQKPIARVAALLKGAAPGRSCTVVDCGHRRELDLAIELPDSELGAVASLEQLGHILDRVAGHVQAHRTTLIFVNTRRMSERLAHLLAERLGEEAVAAHHGSLSRERRQRVEARLRQGDLRALVATSSLELGIDVGPVEMVCQIGSTRNIATLLQRVGRANHSRDGVPLGRLFPLSRDELVESAAMLWAVRDGALDALPQPPMPLDVLAQQLVAEVAAEPRTEQDLFELARSSAAFSELSWDDFQRTLELVSDGVVTGRGRRGAYLHRDLVNHRVLPRRGARLAALLNAGAIPETGDYRVLADPDDTFVGAVNEDFAIESLPGDVFLLGSHSWRIRRVEAGVVRVVDAEGVPPSIPFWLGEAPGRSDELSERVSDLRRLAQQLLESEPLESAAETLAARIGCGRDCARELCRYLDAARRALGVIPTQSDLLFERFFDETEGSQLVVHSPFGSRINRALGLALRKRFCTTFDFELQAAANDDACVLSLGPQHSFPLSTIPGLVRADSARRVLEQALLPTPMFTARWRWNLTRALMVPRARGSSRVPVAIQRMEADDMMAAVFPALAACQENAPAGPIAIPDHLLVTQTMRDCLEEAMDVAGLERLLAAVADGSVRLHFRDSAEPSVLAHEILNGRPFTFLDDAPLEERRTRSVRLRPGLPLQVLTPDRFQESEVTEVAAEVAPDLRDAEELHDLLLALGVARTRQEWQPWFEHLQNSGRAFGVDLGHESGALWAAIERQGLVAAALEGRAGTLAAEPSVWTHEDAVDHIVRGHLEVSRPLSVAGLAQQTALPPTSVRDSVARLEQEGFACRLLPSSAQEETWCARRVLLRLQARRRRERQAASRPATAQQLMRFLLRWQHVMPGEQLSGPRGVLAVLDQLQGFELPAAAWESDVLPLRVGAYQPGWLDELCLSGALSWGRLGLRRSEPEDGVRRGVAAPSRATPLTFALREDVDWLLAAMRGGAVATPAELGAAAEVLSVLRERGALFQAEIRSLTGRLPQEVEDALWELVARGLVTADGFQAVRSLLAARVNWQQDSRRRRRQRSGLRRGIDWSGPSEGRWALLPTAAAAGAPEELAEAAAEQLLTRWGIVFWDLLARESLALPWREVVWALRRMEARGVVVGGRFVTGVAGEQYALPQALEALRALPPPSDEQVELSAADPLNLVGILLPGERVPAVRTGRVAYRDGLPVPVSDRRQALA